jgi:hypothetical protein
MNLPELVLAVLLLTGANPPGLEDPAMLREQFPTFRAGLVGLALEWEILDPRETRYVLARPEDAVADLQMLRRRHEELRNAPPLADAMRFPDRTTVNELLVFNRAYKNYVEVRQPMELAHGFTLRTAQKEVDQLYQVWDTIRDARCEYYYVTVRRQALKRLRDLLGDDDYYNGELPPHVPLWRFQSLDQ